MHTSSVSVPRSSIMLGDPSSLPAAAQPGLEERLPFTVRLVRNEEDLHKAVQVRQAAYARHLPGVAEKLDRPEAADTQPGVAVLLAESKVDGSPLGTARIQTNQHQPLALETAVRLPAWLQGQTLAHVSRLGVAQGGVGRLVKLMLFKGLYTWWHENGIDWAIVAARTPLDRMYEQLLFQDVFPGQGFIPLPHMDHVPHRVMAFEVSTAYVRWAGARHPLTNFIFHTRHIDLDVRETHSGSAWPQHPARAAAPRPYHA